MAARVICPVFFADEKKVKKISFSGTWKANGLVWDFRFVKPWVLGTEDFFCRDHDDLIIDDWEEGEDDEAEDKMVVKGFRLPAIAEELEEQEEE